MDLQKHIRDVHDWPKPGIVFKDITPLLLHNQAFQYAIDKMCEPFHGKDINVVAGAESRGFIFGVAIAQKLGVGFVPIRKPGKLPAKTISMSYELEYGTDSLEIHEDAINSNSRVLLVDDLIASGGTMVACCKLVEQLDGQIMGVSVLIHLTFLDGLEKISHHSNTIHTILEY